MGLGAQGVRFGTDREIRVNQVLVFLGSLCDLRVKNNRRIRGFRHEVKIGYWELSIEH